MSDRRGRKAPYTIDLVLITALKDRLAVLLWRTPEGKEKWALPWETPSGDEILDTAAGRIATEALGALPAWLEQLAAFGADKRHPSDSEASVAFAGLVPAGTPPPVGIPEPGTGILVLVGLGSAWLVRRSKKTVNV